MATLLSSIEAQARRHLIETSPNFWTSEELIDIINLGRKDLWRDIVDLKQEHYLTVDATNVSLAANTATLTGVPVDVHKVYILEARDLSENGSNHGLTFKPLDYNHQTFQLARSHAAVDPTNNVIYYAVHGAGAPTGAPTIYVAPKVTSAVNLSLGYVPTLGNLISVDYVDIPGEADNALIAWTVAYAMGKEHESGNRSPDQGWITIYASEKQHLLQSLGLRQYHEPTYVDALWQEYWG